MTDEYSDESEHYEALDRIKLFNRSDDHLHKIIEVQHTRYHHLQSLSQGLFAILLTIFGITISAILTFHDIIFFPPPGMEAELETIAQSSSVASYAVQLSISANWIIAFLFLTLSFYYIFISSLTMLDVFTERSPPKGLFLQGDKRENDLRIAIRDNQSKLQYHEKEFNIGAMRIIVLSLYLALSSFIYLSLSDYKMWEIFIYDCIIVFPGIGKLVMDLVVRSTSEKQQSQNRLFNEFIEVKERLEILDVQGIESGVLFLIIILALVNMFVWLLSYTIL